MTFFCCKDHLVEALTYEAKQLLTYNAKSATINISEHESGKCQVCKTQSKFMVSIVTYDVYNR
jgi:hypothetical protein